jgi:hypothetical protein
MIFSSKCEILNLIQNFSKYTINLPVFQAVYLLFSEKYAKVLPKSSWDSRPEKKASRLDRFLENTRNRTLLNARVGPTTGPRGVSRTHFLIISPIL